MGLIACTPWLRWARRGPIRKLESGGPCSMPPAQLSGNGHNPSHTPHPRPQPLLEPYRTLSLGTGKRLWSCWPPTVAYLGAPQHLRSAPARGSVTSPPSSLSDHLIVLYSHGSPD